MTQPEISIVLNLHNEGSYIKRTIRSIVEAIFFARQDALTFELIIVLDRPDAFTRKILENIDLSAVQHQIIIVSNGSLGLSRNDGVALAKGKYISLADGDDLISFNYFSACHFTAKISPKSAIFPEFLYAFGSKYHITKYKNSNTFGARAFFDMHPYVSRIFIEREIINEFPFVEIPNNSIYAYEDWHFNSTLIACGYSCQVAKNSWLFYRQRAQSIMATAGQNKITPYSIFFKPEIYKTIARNVPSVAGNDFLKSQILDSVFATEIVYAANQIEPAIDIEHIKGASIWNPPVNHTPKGDAYFEICEQIEYSEYDHVALMPFISRGGAEKYLFNVLSEIQQIEQGKTRILIVTGETTDIQNQPKRLQFGCTLIDVSRVSDKHNVSSTELTFRVIQAVASKAKIHMLSCSFSFEYFSRYKKSNKQQVAILYAFCPARFKSQGRFFIYGDGFSFISEQGEYLDRIISDNQIFINDLRHFVDLNHTRYTTLYSKIEYREMRRQVELSNMGKPLTLLWASRLDEQKRPDLLMKIAKLLENCTYEVEIHAYGGTVLGGVDLSEFEKFPRLKYCGEFDGFETLPLKNYNAFIYTSHFDGVPNVILESMSFGIPVIAPNIGGISEVVINGKTGILLPDLLDDNLMAESYVDTILDICDSKIDLYELISGAHRLLAMQHSPEYFSSQIKEVFLDDRAD